MAHKTEVDPNIYVHHDGVKLKTFSLYDDYAHTKANEYVSELNRDPVFLQSELDRVEKAGKNEQD